MDNTYTVSLRIDPPRGSRLRPLQVHREFSIDYDHGYGAAFRAKENIPDDAEELTRELLDDKALAHKLEHLRKLDKKTDEQRKRVREIVENVMTSLLAKGIMEEWAEDLVDEIFNKIDDNNG